MIPDRTRHKVKIVYTYITASVYKQVLRAYAPT